MRALVTGVAGFIGSTLGETLLDRGHDVRGVDCFTPYYDPAAKRANVSGLTGHPRFQLVDADLREVDPLPLLRDVSVLFHLSAQPGVRHSWAEGFPLYEEQNIRVTQRLLEAARAAGVARVVYASSSSVYGNAGRYPCAEDDLPRPHSPYGVTKLAAEHLCGLYAANWGLSTVSLRYFTVYGPRQRPDMAMHRLIEAGLAGQAFPLYGTGQQVRDFTFVGDVVEANLAAATADLAPGTVVNVAGGGSIRMLELLDLASALLGAEVRIDHLPSQAGDVDRTGGSIGRAEELLGWKPRTDLRAGLDAQVDWHRERRAKPPTSRQQAG
jgi:nucleoside-diphosphate-sugar epimerase